MSDLRASLSRRDFIRSVTLLAGGFIGAALSIPGIAYLISPARGEAVGTAWIDLGLLDQYPVGVPTMRQFTRTTVNGWERASTSYGAFVVRMDASTVRVFSNICTHLGCHVNWHADIRNYVSPCHDGHFDIFGNVISGPPPRPLDEFVTRLEAGKLLIQLPAVERNA